MQCDAHVVKMANESVQMLSTVARTRGIEVGMRVTHVNHPCTLWTGASSENYAWLLAHAEALCNEYSYRYLGTHAAKAYWRALRDCVWLIPFERKERTPFALVMPEEFQKANAVSAYRAFYRTKSSFAKWRTRPAPRWW